MLAKSGFTIPRLVSCQFDCRYKKKTGTGFDLLWQVAILAVRLDSSELVGTGYLLGASFRKRPRFLLSEAWQPRMQCFAKLGDEAYFFGLICLALIGGRALESIAA